MGNPRHIVISSAILAATIGIGGCGTTQRLANHTANVALKHLTTLNDDLNNKIDAEEKYYDGALRRALNDYHGSRKTELTDCLTRYGRSFIAEHKASKKKDPSYVVDGAALAKYAGRVVEDWESREEARKRALADAVTILVENRRKLELANAKLEHLEKHLSVLAKARNKKELLDFFASYAAAVKKSYDEAREEAKSAESKASDATSGLNEGSTSGETGD